jgi:hypothetical protein
MQINGGGHLRPQMGVLLKCELSTGHPAGYNQVQDPEVAPKLENSQFRRTRLIARDVNPIFHHQFLISHHPLTWFVSILYESFTFH